MTLNFIFGKFFPKIILICFVVVHGNLPGNTFGAPTAPGGYKIPYIQGGGDTLIMPFYVYITLFNQIVRLGTFHLHSCDSINVV